MRIRFRGNPFTEQLPNDRVGIADMFTSRYQATHVPSRDRCIATAIHVTVYKTLPQIIQTLRWLFL
jgi:hypothetical protein